MIITNIPFAGIDIKTINVHLVNKNGTKDILSLKNIDNDLKTIELRASTFRRLRNQLEVLTNEIFTNVPAHGFPFGMQNPFGGPGFPFGNGYQGPIVKPYNGHNPAGGLDFGYNNRYMENSFNEQPHQRAAGAQTVQKGGNGILQNLMSIRDTIIEMGSDFNEIEMKEFSASDRSFYVGIGLSSVKIGIMAKDKDALLRVVPTAEWDAQRPDVLGIFIECSDELFERYKSA